MDTTTVTELETAIYIMIDLLQILMVLQVMSPPDSANKKSGRSKEKEERVVSEDTDFVLTTTRDRHFEKEDVTSYVNRKREMFLVQYALGVKREEIQKLGDIAMVHTYEKCNTTQHTSPHPEQSFSKKRVTLVKSVFLIKSLL